MRAESAGLTLKPTDGLDLTRKIAEVQLSNAPATPLGDVGAAAPALARTLDLAAIALAAECTGATARCLESAVAYAKSRIQFGRTIASFQAIKHKAAEVMLELETARSAAYWSWWVAAQQGGAAADLAEAASVAKSLCNDALSRAAAENVHIHGGMGFTWEFDCHLYFRRAKAAEMLFGDPIFHRARLAERLGLVASVGRRMASGDPFDLVWFWKQNDSGLYGRRQDHLVRALAASPRVRRIVHFDRPVPARDLFAGARLLDRHPLQRHENRVLLQTLARLRPWTQRGKLTRHTFLYADERSPLLRRLLPGADGYVDFVRRTLARAGVDPARSVFWVCPRNP